VRPITDILPVNHARPTPNTSANPSKRPISDGDDGDSYADNKDGDGDHVGNEHNINDGNDGNNNSGRRTADMGGEDNDDNDDVVGNDNPTRRMGSQWATRGRQQDAREHCAPSEAIMSTDWIEERDGQFLGGMGRQKRVKVEAIAWRHLNSTESITYSACVLGVRLRFWPNGKHIH